MTEAYDGREVVGMDLHRRRSALVRMTSDGQGQAWPKRATRNRSTRCRAPASQPPGPALLSARRHPAPKHSHTGVTKPRQAW
jgi:hypothetical protein